MRRWLGLLAFSIASPACSDATGSVEGTTGDCSDPGCAQTGSDDATGADGVVDETTAAGDGSSGTAGSSEDGPDCGDIMSDPGNCGVCGHDCLGGECVEGQCQPQPFFMLGSTAQASLAVDDTRLYVGAFDPPDVFAIDKGSGEVTAFEASGNPVCVGLDPERLLFQGLGGLRVVPKTGGPSEVLAATQASIVVAGGGFAFFTTSLGDGPHAVPIAGGTVETLDTSGVGLAIDATHAVWSRSGAAGGIFRAPIGGGEPVQVADAGATPLATDGAFVYFVTQQKLARVPVDGGEPFVLDDDFIVNPVSLEVDETDLYVLGRNGMGESLIARVPLEGGAVVTLTVGFGFPFDFAIDDESIFYAASEPAPAILRLAK